MSARAESPPIRGGLFLGTIVIATVLVLIVFAWVNRAIDDRGAEVRPSASVVGWDAGKLEAMEGRQLAELFRQEQGPGNAAALEEVVGAPGGAGPLARRVGGRH